MTQPFEGALLSGRYRVEGPDADGFAATDLTSGKRVHIALIPRAMVPSARRAMQLTGAHAVRVLDVGETAEGASWIAREHVSSVSLTKHLARRGPLNITESVEVALAVCDAVAEGNAFGLAHGAIDASCVYLAFSASGLVDVQIAGIGTASPARIVDDKTPVSGRRASAEGGARDVRAIAKLIEVASKGSMASAPLPHELAALLERMVVTPVRVLDFAQALVPFAFDSDFASDRIEMRKSRSSSSLSVIADGAYPEGLPPRSPPPPAAPRKRSNPSLADERNGRNARPRMRSKSDSRDMPTIIARRPALAFPRRRAFRILGVLAAALSVALLVLIGTEGARLIHPKHENLTQKVEFAPLPAQAPIAPPVAVVTAEPSAKPIPVVKLADLPAAKPAKKKH